MVRLLFAYEKDREASAQEIATQLPPASAFPLNDK